MRLAEALQIARRPGGGRPVRVPLLCGCMPLHLETYVQAHLRLRFPERAVTVATGVYGDLQGNITRASDLDADGAIVVVEWSDLDPRLGFRNAARWRAGTAADVSEQVEVRGERLERALRALAARVPTVVIAPSLPLSPLVRNDPALGSELEWRLLAAASNLFHRIGSSDRIATIGPASLAAASPPDTRHDLAMELRAGFPYTLTHANAVAEKAIRALFPLARKKALITDLDGTLWKGIVGEVGPAAVSWSLDDKAHVHALYQNVLASLADQGVLIGIVSKNDPAIVQQALERPDLLLSARDVFPVEAGWGPKSDAVSRVLSAWNIAADAVVFVDDSPLELAEVGERHPGIECLAFPTEPAAVARLLETLQDRFATRVVLPEDLLRRESLRSAAGLSRSADDGDFEARLHATVTFEPGDAGPRTLELVNKTNQFNLNGVRYSESEWRVLQQRKGAFTVTISYEDRFGPLGRIAVISGQVRAERCDLDVWVMSCRAFSRQIEWVVLRALFEKTGASCLSLRFTPTDRNGPLQTFLNRFSTEQGPDGTLLLQADDFRRYCPPLAHQVLDTWTL